MRTHRHGAGPAALLLTLLLRTPTLAAQSGIVQPGPGVAALKPHGNVPAETNAGQQDIRQYMAGNRPHAG